ncbi:dynamin protein dnm1 [Cantharellus anzutake]|uniref:dynamin protein dnm1 n=1 Tax=Cantharellus anzutake TaxID=1750568 RepID=UPI001906C4BF|nr:dynamin protein dnm1 [Cantharellus anzutake]KAF8323545.1 dynamin protein dnm1 [Cantharellus anzutake]
MDSELIGLVNKLQDMFSNLGGELDMPQLVVVGSQSAGKSSVLETIVGRDFLPRGQGIVTRRPLVLQLVHVTPLLSTLEREYAQFLHLDKRFTDFEDVRREIEQETLRVAGQNKGISKLPINLRICSPDVLDLTLVDLPGLTKVGGDQPSDIERQIRNLVMDYIGKPNSVILSVSPANVDLANSEALKLARAVDPQGRRTIGVLTKLDLMDAGTNAVDILNGRIYPLRLGFVGVVNRSQQDINNRRSMKDTRQAEADFFTSHPAYRAIAHRNGSKFLTKTLNQVLMNHIREKLPDMKARLNTLMSQTQQELNALGETYASDQDKGSGLVLQLMTQFAHNFVSSIEGTSLEISTKELLGGARIYYIFNEVFGHALNSIDSTSNLSSRDIRTAIRNSTGPRPSLFVPEVAFDLLVKPQIKLLEAPSLRCVEMVYEELVKICHNCSNPELQRFPRLHAQIIEVVSELLRERLGPTSEYISSLIAIQAAYININHPAFVMESRARSTAPPNKQVTDVSRNPEAMEMTVIVDEEEPSDSDGSFPTGGKRQRFPRNAGPEVEKDQRPSSEPLDPAISRLTPGSRTHDALNSPRRVSSTSHSQLVRETFLNYFFGGQTQSISDRNPQLDLLTISPSRSTLDNSITLDMKSLGKHLEPASHDAIIQLSAREEMEANLIRSLIGSYFHIVRQSIQDLVPKAIMHFLVNNTSQQVQNRLVATLYKPELFSELLDEDEALVNERSRVRALLEAYKEAFKTLSEVALKPSSGATVL